MPEAVGAVLQRHSVEQQLAVEAVATTLPVHREQPVPGTRTEPT